MTDLLTPWERQRIENVERTLGSLPLYDSAQWHALEADDPRRWASVIRAAACWRHGNRLDVIEQRLQEELARCDQLALERVRSASHAVSSGADWVAMAQEPTHADLVERRGAA